MLRVSDPKLWRELEALVPLDAHVHATLSDTERAVDVRLRPTLERALRRSGRHLLVRRMANAPAIGPEPANAPTPALGEDPMPRVDRLSPRARALLQRVQRRACCHHVVGGKCWDPHAEVRAITELVDAQLIELLADDLLGHVRIVPGLPPPPDWPYDFSEALMPPPDDLALVGASLRAVEGDLAALAGCYTRDPPRRTLNGTLEVAALKRIGRALADPSLEATGRLREAHPRWARADRLLELLNLIEEGDVDRQVRPSARLKEHLCRPEAERYDALLRRVVDAEHHPLLAPLRAALAQADAQAVDEVIFTDLLAEQHRDVLHSPWGQVGVKLYPQLPGELPFPFDRDAFDLIEGPAIAAVLAAGAQLGLLRVAPGVFAATAEGRAWAGLAPLTPAPGVLISPDLSLLVPPGALDPWSRYLLEQLAPAEQRDVVDRHRLKRSSLLRWLQRREIDEAIALLSDNAAHGLPEAVEHTLRAWASAAERVVWIEP